MFTFSNVYWYQLVYEESEVGGDWLPRLAQTHLEKGGGEEGRDWDGEIASGHQDERLGYRGLDNGYLV